MKKATEWTVLFHLEFDEWLSGQEEGLQNEVWVLIGLLKQFGPSLSRPYADTVKGSIYPNMKELRIQHRGKPWRVLFAFDPNRNAILLVGGTKVGKQDWYDVHIPVADERFRRYLAALRRSKKG
jgi:hypothetical protein